MRIFGKRKIYIASAFITLLICLHCTGWVEFSKSPLDEILLSLVVIFMTSGFTEIVAYKDRVIKFNWFYNHIGNQLSLTKQSLEYKIESINAFEKSGTLKIAGDLNSITQMPADVWILKKGFEQWSMEEIVLVEAINLNTKNLNAAMDKVTAEIDSIKNLSTEEQAMKGCMYIRKRILESMKIISDRMAELNEQLIKKIKLHKSLYSS